MELEETEGVEHAGSRCEVCGTPLTPAEQSAVLEDGGPVLCSVHATEAETAAADAEPDDAA
jgi:hypothetical protein